MSNRQVLLGVVGAALIAAGLLALWFPVHLGQYDQWGMQISCGRGFNGSLSQTPGAHDANLAGQCATALLLGVARGRDLIRTLLTTQPRLYSLRCVM